MSSFPTIFVSHGSPMLALQDSPARRFLLGLGAELPRPKAILVFSAHWETGAAPAVSLATHPETIHDFGGFPQALFDIRYQPAGAPDVAERAAELFAAADIPVGRHRSRGLDHGAWVPLRHLLPDAQLPVFQVSLPHDLDTAGALRLGQALAPLRARGVLVVGSGSMTHNLYEFRHAQADAADYAVEFTHWIRQAVNSNAVDKLVDYRQRAPHALRAHPTEEHYLPLLVAMGARSGDEPAHVIDGGITNGVLSMESYAWGLPVTAH